MFGVPFLLVAASWAMLRRHYRLDEGTYARIVAELREREASGLGK